jgi:hypothetical protein
MEKESFEAYDKKKETLWFQDSWKYTSEIYLIIWAQKDIAGLMKVQLIAPFQSNRLLMSSNWSFVPINTWPFPAEILRTCQFSKNEERQLHPFQLHTNPDEKRTKIQKWLAHLQISVAMVERKKKIKTSTGKRSNGQRIYKEKLRFQQSFNLFLSRFYELREIKQTNTQDQQDRGHGSKREKQMFYFRIKKDEICKLSLNDLGQVWRGTTTHTFLSELSP